MPDAWPARDAQEAKGLGLGWRRSTLLALVLAWAVVACVAPRSTATADGTPTPLPTATPAPTPTATRAPTPTSSPTLPALVPGVAPAGPAPLVVVPVAPARDVFDLAQRYQGVTATPVPLARLLPDEPVGTVRDFFVINPEVPRVSSAAAELRRVGERAAWWVQRDVPFSDAALAEVAARFDTEVAPGVIAASAPGTALPGRVSVVVADLTGVAGYFSPADTLPKVVFRFSNERLAVFVQAPEGPSPLPFLGTLAHEFQHLVHFLADPTEETWVSEGLAEHAVRTLGLPGLPVGAYLRQPETSFVDWPTEVGASLPYYAAASLFTRYLAERFGQEVVRGLVAEAADGVDGVRRVMARFAPEQTLDGIVLDWMTANVVAASEARFAYARPAGTALVLRRLPEGAVLDGAVAQYGAWYARVDPLGSPLTVTVRGTASTPALPVEPRDGACWWSNRGDSVNPRLTRPLDLRGLQRATLRFREWHDLERQFDHAYVSVSADGGRTWRALAGRFTVADDPLGVAFGPSYTGASAGWQDEVIDLTAFVGGAVLLRFEMVTDDSVNRPGWCVDDIAVPEVGFADDAESDGDWTAEGFVRITKAGIAQPLGVRLVIGARGSTRVVAPEAASTDGSAQFTVVEPAVLIVTGLATRTSEPARFSVTVRKAAEAPPR